ncbi:MULTISPECIES: YheU family protein [Vibrio]|jgi:uncharacterized protein|uniref:UPF0270 protein GCM10007931_17560 n=1 Tax=Vibrio algivorus TaxID=1667024 RepID=A0ABQ6EP62_9VIBR|nr:MULTISPECIES: YheU family protein [Vibrio]MCF7353629.1 YheU family protein [Vibrio sp. CK2-1]GLT14781.1 UPF0270 protein [Vibrio algivorus]
MIIPWQDIDPDTLENLIKEFILREGTDYGMQETSLETKIKQVKGQLKSGSVAIVFSELHESVDIKPINELN